MNFCVSRLDARVRGSGRIARLQLIIHIYCQLPLQIILRASPPLLLNENFNAGSRSANGKMKYYLEL